MHRTAPTATGASRPMRAMFRAQGGFMLVSGLAAAPLVWFMGGLFAKIAREAEVEVPAVSMFCIEQRPVLVLIAAVAAGCGLGLLVTKRGRWLWLAGGTCALLLIVALAIIGLLGLIAPMYQYQELG